MTILDCDCWPPIFFYCLNLTTYILCATGLSLPDLGRRWHRIVNWRPSTSAGCTSSLLGRFSCFPCTHLIFLLFHIAFCSTNSLSRILYLASVSCITGIWYTRHSSTSFCFWFQEHSIKFLLVQIWFCETYVVLRNQKNNSILIFTITIDKYIQIHMD